MQILVSPTTVSNATPQSQLSLLKSALVGGAATSVYFNSRNQLTQLCQMAARTPASSWQTSSGQAGQQTATLSMGPMSASVCMSISSASAIGAMSNGSGPPDTGVTFGGVTYNVVGSTQITLSVQQYAWVTECAICTSSFLASVGALQTLVSTALQAVVQGVIGGISTLSSAGATAATAAEADTAATEAVAEGGDAEAALETAALTGSFLGFLGALAITYAVADLILHQTQHRVTVINLTDYPITWSIPYTYEGALQSQPSQAVPPGGSNYQVEYVIPGAQSVGPPWLNQTQAYSSADFQFVSSDTSGLGYVMEFNFTDTSSNTAYVPMATFDIPFEGDNSLNCVFGVTSIPEPPPPAAQMNAVMAGVMAYRSLSNWYALSQGQNKVTTFTAISADGKYSITATYDMLSGQQPSPTGGSVGYFYNSLIIIQPA